MSCVNFWKLTLRGTRVKMSTRFVVIMFLVVFVGSAFAFAKGSSDERNSKNLMKQSETFNKESEQTSCAKEAKEEE